MPKVRASEHAIKRFRQRANRRSSSDEEIKNELETVVGKARDNHRELRYCGLILCIIRDTITTVLTPNMLERRGKEKRRSVKYLRGKKTYS